ncbi:sugar phosphate isomerase/epimerase [Lewinella marina]|uniref:Sugar phosphate isomerase n=1 Tax=Neolewinella marina TaxID=438751 RepID=A0A2G0CCB3_9BACT|nr:sugar phosphate isomerase/epimerase [Neolewinella marina]NJB86775.1 sugar phosphate isomerase/epimerase [Neolewinella marina]PHK97580.1 sugar phosphate isomerase [Neolewinella marina]
MTDRRKFLRQSAKFGAAGLLLPVWACGANSGDQGESVEALEDHDMDAEAAGGSIETFGIQLYTLRDVLPQDVKGTLRKIADYGYKQIEGYEGNQGLFWGMENTEFKDYLDELGLTMVASHCNIDENFEQKAQQAAAIGMDYLICPYIGAQAGRAGWQAVVDKFNQRGQTCADNGIRFAYHNHGYSFEEVDGIIPQDFMMENTTDAVDYEMDIYWVVTGGADPVDYLNKYPGKWKLCHVKDREQGADPAESEASVDLGTGSIDFARILSVAEEQGMEYYIVEQERYPNSTPLKSAEVDAKYLKQLKFS